ncbi:IncQ-type mobilization protein MobB, partial [Massilia sp. DJPM01]|uniref:IncQ-type mobilization protein MobB n=1 Tax=Massilia sp. DJPM01 TaxID=3024404 RepID=UPI00259DD461
EDLAVTLEPLAQALTALTDETRQTLIEIDRKSQEQAEKFASQLTESVKGYKEAAAEASKAAESLDLAGQRMEWRHYALAVVTGLFTAMLVSAFWLWLNPPVIKNSVDAEAVAEALKPVVIEALKRSKNK